MSDRVGGQLVNDQDYVLRPVFGQACLAGMKLDSSSQCAERAGIERQVQNRDDWDACRVVIGHAIASSPVRFGQIGYVRHCPPQDRRSSCLRPGHRHTLYLPDVPVNRSGGHEPGEQVWPSG
jgi:hypothetical protein